MANWPASDPQVLRWLLGAELHVGGEKKKKKKHATTKNSLPSFDCHVSLDMPIGKLTQKDLAQFWPGFIFIQFLVFIRWCNFKAITAIIK